MGLATGIRSFLRRKLRKNARRRGDDGPERWDRPPPLEQRLRAYREHQQRLEEDIPSSLSKIRKRALTLDATVPASVVDHGRANAGLLGRLPPEIRSMVWMMVLSGERLHITREPRGKLGYLVCCKPGDKDAGRHTRCWGAQDGDGYTIREETTEDGRMRKNLLALVKTCRWIYSETIDIAYAHNTFSFNQLFPLTYLPMTLLPQRQNTIRSLRLQWHFWRTMRGGLYRADFDRSSDGGAWERACAAIESMKGLRDVKIMLTSWLREEWAPWMLEPLTSVTVQGPFEVYVNWATYAAEEAMVDRGVPFRLVRRTAFNV